MSSGELRPASSPATTSCSSCTSSQSRTPRSTGSIRSPASSFACSIESQQTKTARSRTTLSSSRAPGRFAPAAQTSAPGLQPLAAEHRVLRGRGRDDDVLLGRVAVGLAGLGAEASCRTRSASPRCGSRRRPLDPRQRLADARDLALGLPAAADHAERSSRPAWRGTSPRHRWPRRSGAGPACRPRSRRRAGPSARSKSTTTNGVPPRLRSVGLEPGEARAPRRRPDMTASAALPGARRVRGRFATSPRAMRSKHASTAANASAGVSSFSISASVR